VLFQLLCIFNFVHVTFFLIACVLCLLYFGCFNFSLCACFMCHLFIEFIFVGHLFNECVLNVNVVLMFVG